MSGSNTLSTETDEVIVDKFKPSGRFMAAFTSLAIVNLACALDATDIGVALPVITGAIGGNAVQALWMGTSFLLASTVWQPLFIAVSDVFGRRPLLVVALILFTAGTIMCAVSKEPALMLTGRSVQGSGVGGVLTLTEAIITDLVPLRERGNFLALISIVWAVGTVAGPLVGGALAQNHAWRWIFYLNLPILGIGFVGVIVFLNQDLRQRGLLEKLRKIDYVGSFLFVSSLTSMLIALSWGGTMYSWSSWHTLVPLILGAAGLAVFTVHQVVLGSESRPAEKRLDTLLPMRIFANRSTSITYMTTFLHGMILWTIVYYMPLYFQSAKSYTPIQTGLTALPQTLTVVPCAMVVGVVSSKTGYYRWSLYLGFAITTLGMGLLYLLDVGTTVVEWVFLLLVGGIGIGLLFPGMNLSIQASVPNKDIAIAAGLFTFFRAAGQSVGVAVGEAIFQNRLTKILSPYPELQMTSLDAISIIREISSLPPVQSSILKHAYADAIKTIWATMCGLSGVALIATFFVKEYTLDQMLAGEQGFVDSGKAKEAGAIDKLSGDEAEKAVTGSSIGDTKSAQ